MPLGLRGYQVEAINEARAQVRAGKRAPLLCAAPGAGKTRTAAAMAASHIGKGGRVAWFSPRIELVAQAADALAETGAPHDRWVSTTYQGVLARGEAPDATLSVFDECQCLPVVGEFQRVAAAYSSVLRIGLSATPERADGSALAGFDCIVPVSSYSELIALGFLVPCAVYSPDHVLKGRELIARPVDAYLDKCRGELAVCFGPTVEACQRFAEEFRWLGVRAEVVHAGSLDRDEVLARWRARETMVVCNVGILTEGYDLPAISCVILARSVGTCGLFLQCTGRGLRPFPGKTKMTLLDLSGAANLHGSPTCDREYSLDGVGIRQAGVEMPSGTLCAICGNPPPCECGGREQTEMAITGSVRDLKPWISAMRAEPDDQRAIRLARWFRECERKGQKEARAKVRFKAVYDHWPSTEIINAALKLCATKPADPRPVTPPPAQTSLLESAS